MPENCWFFGENVDILLAFKKIKACHDESVITPINTVITMDAAIKSSRVKKGPLRYEPTEKTPSPQNVKKVEE